MGNYAKMKDIYMGPVKAVVELSSVTQMLKGTSNLVLKTTKLRTCTHTSTMGQLHTYSFPIASRPASSKHVARSSTSSSVKSQSPKTLRHVNVGHSSI